MSEQEMRQRVVRALKDLDACSVENPAHPGTPDVNYVEGWIELKHVAEWPIENETPLRIPHFTPQQRVWLTRRYMRGGNAWLLLQVENDWLLFDGKTASELIGKSTRQDLLADVRSKWGSGLQMERELAGCLSRLRS